MKSQKKTNLAQSWANAMNIDYINRQRLADHLLRDAWIFSIAGMKSASAAKVVERKRGLGSTEASYLLLCPTSSFRFFESICCLLWHGHLPGFVYIQVALTKYTVNCHI